MQALHALHPDALPTVMDLASHAGPGLTSLPPDKPVLDHKLAASWEHWQHGVSPTEDKLLFGVSDHDGHLIGLSGIAPRVGLHAPFVNFRITTEHQHAPSLNIDVRHRVLVACNDCTGWSELGSLLLAPSARGGGIGRLASLGRMLYLADHPTGFADTIFAELRGVCDDDGHAPLWDALGTTFFDLPFVEADRLSAVTDKAFIGELLPRHPIYLDLLPEPGRAVIGQPHPRTEPARRLLASQGFDFNGLIDIFDGGPVLSIRRERISAIAASRCARVTNTINHAPTVGPALVSNQRHHGFTCCLVERLGLVDDQVVLSHAAARTLDVVMGDPVRVWLMETP